MLNFLFEIVSMSIIASVIFVIVSIFKPLTEKKCTTKWQLNLLKVTLIMFVFPISKMIERLVDILGMKEVIRQIPKIYIQTQNHVVSNASTVQEVQTISSNISIANALLLIWILGVVLSFAWTWYCRKRFLNNVFNHCEKTTNINKIKIINKCKTLFEVKDEVEMMESDYAKSPMLIGILSPKILLPKQTHTAEHLEYIVSHELIHLKRKDLVWKNVLLAVRIIHWFNPLVYLFAIEFDKYIEYLCDELVVEQLNHSERKNYGFAILESMYIQTTPTHSSVGVGFATTELKIERRLTHMLNFKKMKKSSKIMSGLMAIAIMATMAVPVFASEVSELTVKDSGGVLREAPSDATLTAVGDFTVDNFHENNLEISTLSMGEVNVDEWVGKIESGEIQPNSTDHIDVYTREGAISVENYTTDQSGNKVADNGKANSTYANCDHTYTPIIRTIHYLYSDNSCLQEVYDALKCYDCNEVWYLELQSATESRVCRH